MNKKKIILLVLLLVIVGAGISYKMYNKPHKNITETPVDIYVSADTILEEFSLDEKTANSKYLEKIIAVNGAISSLKIENGKGIITLTSNKDFGGVLCHLSEKSSKKINTLKNGQIITVKGICTGYLMDVVLVKSEF
ncbi:hypothetical protein BW723_16805 [Polaribacter reichenbachii]|uniref:tRNA_anti-like n=1 Tax=Polaribacter reichenbachii TaxID=996801 RepID=A0A1B8U5S5_9FLAO|nr:hypothetical protein [Polaribacter reichenbachii]APZ47850.1 hypothetical protein BW723_16805 [Polaribacter reichenbachii]AUC18484.1 hypothetical protein BTO17_07200 [Polaribacter reichenbachii]OBY67202.1 hypothetical protein LPB301_03450 [Polaribacter reichenbachii]